MNTIEDDQQVYINNCQQVLNDISTVKEFVLQVADIKEIYYPISSSFNILSINNEELTDSIPQLLDMKLNQSIQHLNNLAKRVSDISSKILVTGDLNSGKSTLVNALLKQDILPVDQQPCTSIFCEVISLKDKETTSVHAIQDVTTYDKFNNETFHSLETRHLYKLLTDEEQEEKYKMIKIYTSRDEKLIEENNLLYNEIVNISLIDSPGLNTDSVKTTAIFAREEEIDVVVFVVSAENHFTLSGKEFLFNATNEKTHIFIVVNRFDNIRDKERCKRLILDQIKQLSPTTYEQKDNLIHFISAENESMMDDFINMEQKLRSFVFNNRIQSKLLPAQNYLLNLLRDIYFISTMNESKSIELLENVKFNLESNFLPKYINFINAQEFILNQIDQLKLNCLKSIETNLNHSLQQISNNQSIEQCIHSISYPGLLLTFQYAQDIVDSLSLNLQQNLLKIENQLNIQTIHCINQMNQITLEELKEYPIKNNNNNYITAEDSHKPIHITIETKDVLLLDVEDKRNRMTIMSGLTTLCTTTILIQNTNKLSNNSRRFMTLLSLACLGYTAYSFISIIPQALEINLKRKFKTCIENENFILRQTDRINSSVQYALETKQSEIIHLIKQLKSEKESEKSLLETTVFDSTCRLNHFKKLVQESNNLLQKVEESLSVMASPLI